MKKKILPFVLLGLLTACGGIPLRSIPKLINLQNDLLAANPADFMVAIQADARMVPPADAAPVLLLSIKSSRQGVLEVAAKRIPMEFSVTSANSLGLATPASDRRWLIYSLPSKSQAELLNIQSYFKKIQTSGHGNKSGNISVGIAQDGIAVQNPLLANTRWESWVQVSRQGGFLEFWSGTVADLLRQATANSKN